MDNNYNLEDEPRPDDYILMESGEPWRVFLNWIRRLINSLHSTYKSSPDWVDQENFKLASCLQKQFDDAKNVGTLEKFAQFLSYGSHICLILHLTNNNWVDRGRINWSEQVKHSDLLTGANIDLFRYIAQKKLLIPAKYLLQTEHLQKLEEFGKLITTFSSISCCTVFVKRLVELNIQLKPFSVMKYEPYDLSTYCEQSEYYDNRDLYQDINIQSLEESGSSNNSLSSGYETVPSIEYPGPAVSQLEKGDAVSQSELGAGESTASGEQSELQSKIEKAQTKIKYILAEIEKTESNYCDQLQFLDSVYRNSLTEIGHGDLVHDILDETRISELSAAHLSFLSDLIECQGDVIKFTNACMKTDRIRLLVKFYTSYLKNYSRAQEKLDVCLANLTPDKQQILNRADNRAATGGSKSFDIKTNFKQPFQRFCRYPLLLKTLLDAVEKTGFEDHIKNTSSALKTWKHITDHLNFVKSDEEMSTSILPKVLARSGIIEDVSPLGTLESAYSLDETSGSKGGATSNRGSKLFRQYNKVEEFEKYSRFIKDECLTVIVETFNDKKSSSSKKSHKYNVALTELQLIFNKSTILNLRMGINSDLKYETGKFVSSSKANVSNIKLSLAKTSYILLFSSEFNFNSWKQKFEEVIDLCMKNPAKHNEHIFEFFSFEVEKEPVFCSVCGFVLKGLVWQGHLCIMCKSKVHPQCRADSMPCDKGRLNSAKTRSASFASTLSEQRRNSSPTMTTRKTSATERTVVSPRRADTFFVGQQRFTSFKQSALEHVEEPQEEKAIDEEGWFIGMASKHVTKSNLELFLDQKGTFLVRLSDRDPGYRLAVVDSSAQVKHIQIFSDVREGDKEVFYLEEGQTFTSINELITFYRRTNLSSVFADYIDVYLQQSLADSCYDLIRAYADQTDSQEYNLVTNPMGAAVMLKRLSAAPSSNHHHAVTELKQGQLVFVFNESDTSFECQLSPTHYNTNAAAFLVPKTDVRIITAFGAIHNT